MSEPAPNSATVTREDGLRLLEQMVRIRRFEEKCVELYSTAKIRGFMHLCIGEEAISAGALMELAPDEAVTSTYREHGHAMARGIPPGAILAEMYGKQEGCSRGRGGSMHLFDARTRFYGGGGIVGAGLPVAVGLALADRMQGRQRATCCVFGDGAAAEGEFPESLNLAALWKVPVVFLCENNLYAMGTALRYEHATADFTRKAEAYGVPGRSVDGMDVLATRAAMQQALAHVRSGAGPYFLECQTYRFRAHSMFDAELYREKSEVEEWRKRDPIPTLIAVLKTAGHLDRTELEALERRVDAEIAAAVAFAEAGTWEPVEDLLRFVHSESSRTP